MQELIGTAGSRLDGVNLQQSADRQALAGNDPVPLLRAGVLKKRPLGQKNVQRRDASGKSFSENLAQATSRNRQNTAAGRRHFQAQPSGAPSSGTAEMANQSAKVIEHTVRAGETIWELAVKRYHVHVEDILRDNNITNPRNLQVGQKLVIRKNPNAASSQEVVASWYGHDFHGRDMANGAPFNMYANTIAHKDLPLGTRVELENPATGQKARAVITDRGPFIEGRDVDLSYGLATKLSLAEQGVGSLRMRVL